jgi:hypothetical protein
MSRKAIDWTLPALRPWATLRQRTVENPPGLLRLDQLHVDVTGTLECPSDPLWCDLVEGQSVDRDLRFENLEQVPGDRFPLAVLIRRQENLGGLLERGLDFGNDLLLLRRHHVVRLESVLHVHGELAEGPSALVRWHLRRLGQVPNMPHGGDNLVAVAEEPADSAGLRGRLDYDEATTVGHGPCFPQDAADDAHVGRNAQNIP